MPKVLVIEPCIINLGDDRGGVDHAVGVIAEPTKDTAWTLAQHGRALYVDPKDDPSKGNHYTASKALLKAAEAAAKAKAAAAKAPAGVGDGPGSEGTGTD